MNLFSFIYNGFNLGLFLSILAFQNEWLEMRMNIGLIIFITIGISIVTYVILNKQKRNINYVTIKVFSFLILALSFSISFFILGFSRFKTLPASIFREAIGITSLSFSVINNGLIVFILVGFLLILCTNYKKQK